MPTGLTVPTTEDVRRILNIQDPVIRNLLITHCYHELSAVLARRTGKVANWCTFATWASKQAGQTIRKEDLARLLDSRLKRSPSTVQASENFAAVTRLKSLDQFEKPKDLALSPRNFMAAIDRASDAVSRGNKKVFEEIGSEFARFYDTCLLDQTPDSEKILRFCEELSPGEPPDGQNYLRQAFTHYYQALFENNVKAKAELILLANIEIGFHEQTRLQHEIAESLDAGAINFLQFTRPLLASILPMSGWFNLAYLLTNIYGRRLLGRPTAIDLAIQTLIAEVKSHLRQAITETMMSISLPSGILLKLGEDLEDSFPDSLKEIMNSDLSLLLEKFDLTPNSPIDSGVLDWAELSDRLHFIIDLFRCYQENPDLFEPPFTQEQVDELKSGRLPPGRL